MHCYHNQAPGVKVVDCNKVVYYNKAVECNEVVVDENVEWVTTVSLSAKRREN